MRHQCKDFLDPVRLGIGCCGIRIGGFRRIFFWCRKVLVGFLQDFPQPFPQFGGGRLREGHHEDLFDRDAMLDHKAQVQCLNAERLTRSRTGLDEAKAGRGKRL